MKTNTIIPAVVAAGLFSCSKGSELIADAAAIKTLHPIKNIQNRKLYQKHFDTEYEYADSTGASLLIQNSFPKSGIKYTGPDGKNYVYAVFWTCVTNKTVKPFELKLEFPLNAFEFPFSSGNYFRLLLPPDTMTLNKNPAFDYGLAVKCFLDSDASKSSLKRTIYPKKSTGFYVVTLSNRGVGGTLRAGLSIAEQNFLYSINDKKILCGKVYLQNLVLQK